MNIISTSRQNIHTESPVSRFKVFLFLFFVLFLLFSLFSVYYYHHHHRTGSPGGIAVHT